MALANSGRRFLLSNPVRQSALCIRGRATQARSGFTTANEKPTISLTGSNSGKVALSAEGGLSLVDGSNTAAFTKTEWTASKDGGSGTFEASANPSLNLTGDEGGTVTISVGEGALISMGERLEISIDDITEDSGTVRFVELDVCHMGAHGKRQFLCGAAYAA